MIDTLLLVIKRRTLAGAFLALALGAAACGGDVVVETRQVEVGSDGVNVVESEDGADGVTESAVQTISGSDFSLEDYAGQDLLVWFWAPW